MKNQNTLSLSSIIVKKNDLLESSVDDETILLSISTSKYYGMDPVAARIWSLLDKAISISAIIDIILTEYDVTRKDCEKDVLAFVTALIEEKLIDLKE